MYLTPTEAATRLSQKYSIDATVLIGDVIIASEELREHAPFVADVDLDNPPDGLLDWVSLRAHVLSEDEPGPVTTDNMSPFSRTYARPEHTRNGKRLERLLRPYLAHKGRVA